MRGEEPITIFLLDNNTNHLGRNEEKQRHFRGRGPMGEMGRVISSRKRGSMGRCEAPTVSHHKKADFLVGFFSLWMRLLLFFWALLLLSD